MKRYTATIEIYLYAKSNELALQESNRIAKELDDKYDNKAATSSLFLTPFASMEKQKIEI